MSGDLDHNKQKGLWERGNLVKWIVNREHACEGFDYCESDSVVSVETKDRNDFELEYSQISEQEINDRKSEGSAEKSR